jgi:alpha-L-fucosidase 2
MFIFRARRGYVTGLRVTRINMKHFARNILTGFLLSICFAARALGADQTPRLWYRQPAQKWTEALPIGNGRLGGMIFGGIASERIQFNEDTLWKGHPHDYARDGAGQHLAQIRQLLADGKLKEAEKLTRETFLSAKRPTNRSATCA